MAQEQFIRQNTAGEARTYTAQFGKDEAGNWLPIKLIHNEVNAFSGQPVEQVFKSLHIESDREGNITIQTEFFDDQYTPTGLLSPSFSRTVSERTKDSEAQYFFDQLRGMLEKNILNLLAAGGSHEGSGFLGHPENRFFNPDGSVNNSPETETMLPTYGYHAG